MKFVLVILYFFGAFAFGQQPAWFVLGEKEFANADIYSLLYSKNGELYAATDRGLFNYRHGGFEQVRPTPEQKGSSLFNLVEDGNGKVYCGNLSGQVFVIQKGQLELFASVPESELHGVFNFLLDEENRLIYSSRNCLIVEDGNLRYLYKNDRFSTGDHIFQFPDKRICLLTYHNDSIGWIQNGKVTFEPIPPGVIPQEEKDAVVELVQIESRLILFHRPGKSSVIRGENLTDKVKTNQVEMYHQLSKDTVWARGLKAGARMIYVKENELRASEILFPQKFVSSIAKGPERTHFFGTFKKGIMVVPNLDLVNEWPFETQESFLSCAADSNGGIFASTQSGKVYHFHNGEVTLADDNSSRSIPSLFFIPHHDFKLNSSFPGLILANNTWQAQKRNVGAVKDVLVLKEGGVIVAGASGISKFGEGLGYLKWKKMADNWQKLEGMDSRCRSVAYSETDTSLYFATSYGVFRIAPSGKVTEIKWQENSIQGNFLQRVKGKIWCGTRHSGMLSLENGLASPVPEVNREAPLGEILKFSFRAGKLFLLHSGGFKIYDFENGEVTNLGTAEGLSPGSISDFVLSGDKLWLIRNSVPISMSLASIRERPNLSTLEFDSVLVAGQPVDISRKGKFSHGENRLSVYLNFNGVFFEEETLLESRIHSADEWQLHPANTRSLDFPSLSPGNYTFEIRPVFRGEPGPSRLYTFQIQPPFWQTWWFFGISVGVISMAFMLIFRYRVQRKLKEIRRQNELNASKLTAIQSQMNPHFIFNSLNSIQDMVLRGDVESSYSSISQFADLVRRTLNYSEKEFIPFEQEIELIELYLSLEKLRFNEELEYVVVYEKWEGLKLPPLLIQPFIENALVHGLLHKEGQRRLKIEFELGETLICTISDNGIGREAANKIRMRQRGEHQSFSVQAIQRRFEILGARYKGKIGFKYEDLEDENGEVAGTRVVLILPVQRSL